MERIKKEYMKSISSPGNDFVAFVNEDDQLGHYSTLALLVRITLLGGRSVFVFCKFDYNKLNSYSLVKNLAHFKLELGVFDF